MLTVYHDDDHSNNLIMNCRKSLSCNNFPTVPSRPYFNCYCIIYMHVYYMLCMCSIVNNQRNICILDVCNGSFPDLNRARSASMLCTVPSYGVFPLHSRHIRGSSCRSAPSRSVPASTQTVHTFFSWLHKLC